MPTLRGFRPHRALRWTLARLLTLLALPLLGVAIGLVRLIDWVDPDHTLP